MIGSTWCNTDEQIHDPRFVDLGNYRQPFCNLMFGHSKVVEHQNLAKKSKIKRVLLIMITLQKLNQQILNFKIIFCSSLHF